MKHVWLPTNRCNVSRNLHISLWLPLCGALLVTACSKNGPPATSALPKSNNRSLCIFMPDQETVIVEHGPCSSSDITGAGGGIGGGTVTSGAVNFSKCDAQLKTDQAKCKTLKSPQERGTCEGNAVGAYVTCLFNQVDSQYNIS